jgi:SNF2 family DNA or RNA helicase
LPPIERKIVQVEFTESERFFYNVLLNRSQTVFEGFIAAGTASKSWLAIFSLLQRLRQACDHFSLIVKHQIIEPEEKENEFCDEKEKARKNDANPTHGPSGGQQINDEVSFLSKYYHYKIISSTILTLIVINAS